MNSNSDNEEDRQLHNTLRFEMGLEKLKELFNDLASKDKEELIRQLNNEDLHFPTLYILYNEIIESGILNKLNERNQLSIELLNNFKSFKPKNKDDLISTLHHFNISYDVELAHFVLKWIFMTGSSVLTLDDNYTTFIDIVAVLLLREFRDYTILLPTIDLMFQRDEEEIDTHNLIWAFFEANEPKSLSYIASRLRSKKPKERELARLLLEFVPGIDLNIDDGTVQYSAYQRWYEENGHFIYYTGQTRNQTSIPVRYKVDYKAKYIGHFYSIDSEKISDYLSNEEIQIITIFESVDEDKKIRLADYSAFLRNTNPIVWKDWIHKPIETQLKEAE
ncbi:MAG: hypothetical protein ACFFC6_18060 [Promethearchaeota archaeon]